METAILTLPIHDDANKITMYRKSKYGTNYKDECVLRENVMGSHE